MTRLIVNNFRSKTGSTIDFKDTITANGALQWLDAHGVIKVNKSTIDEDVTIPSRPMELLLRNGNSKFWQNRYYSGRLEDHMTSRIVVNNIQSDSGINTVTFNSEVSSTKFVAGQITVGDTVINSNSIGIGSTSTTGRNAGINTALGTIIYNGTTNRIESYGPEGWVTVKSLTQQGHTATGGIINDRSVGSNYYRTHTFFNTGTFSVTTLGSYTETVKVLVAGGGGGGGGTTTGPGAGGGGGGGGALKYDSTYPIAAASYTVTIGSGGSGGAGIIQI